MDVKCDAISGHLVGHSSIQGWRSNMEDKHVIEDLNLAGHSILGVFDGHNGSECSLYCSANIVNTLYNSKKWKEYKNKYTEYMTNKNKSHQQLHNENEKLKELNTLIGQAIVETYITLDEEYYNTVINLYNNELIHYAKSFQPKIKFDINFLNNKTDIHDYFFQDFMVGGGCTAVCAIITPTHVIVG